MFNPGRTKKKKKILYHDKYNDLYTHPCNTRILFRVLIRVDKILLFSLLLFVQLFFHQKKKKNKGSNYTLTSETYQPTSKRLILRPSSRPNLLLLNFKKRKKKSTQFDKIVKKKHDDVARIIPRQQQVKKKYTRGESKTQLIELLIGLD